MDFINFIIDSVHHAASSVLKKTKGQLIIKFKDMGRNGGYTTFLIRNLLEQQQQ